MNWFNMGTVRGRQPLADQASLRCANGWVGWLLLRCVNGWLVATQVCKRLIGWLVATQVCSLFVGWLLALCPINILVFDRDGSAQTSVQMLPH